MGGSAKEGTATNEAGGMAYCQEWILIGSRESNSHEANYFVCYCCRRNSVLVVEKH